MVSLEVLIVIGIVLLLLLAPNHSPTVFGERPDVQRGDGRTTDGRSVGEG